MYVTMTMIFVTFQVFLWLGYTSSTLNPIIYTVSDKRARCVARHLHGVQSRVQEHVSATVALSLLWRRRRFEANESAAAAGSTEPVPHQRQRDAGLATTCRHVVQSSARLATTAIRAAAYVQSCQTITGNYVPSIGMG